MSGHVILPPLTGVEDAAWDLVVDLALATRTSDGRRPDPPWLLVGGLMVHLHAYQHGRTPGRITTDVDVLVDIAIAADTNTERIARMLIERFGMRMATSGTDRRGHRFWHPCSRVVVDVLAPDGYDRPSPPRTIPPAHTIEVPGGRYVLTAGESVSVTHRQRTAAVWRPRLLAAIVGKWRAYSEIPVDPEADRHLRDIVTLLSLVDVGTILPSNKERQHLRRLITALDRQQRDRGGDVEEALDVLAVLISAAP